MIYAMEKEGLLRWYPRDRKWIITAAGCAALEGDSAAEIERLTRERIAPLDAGGAIRTGQLDAPRVVMSSQRHPIPMICRLYLDQMVRSTWQSRGDYGASRDRKR